MILWNDKSTLIFTIYDQPSYILHTFIQENNPEIMPDPPVKYSNISTIENWIKFTVYFPPPSNACARVLFSLQNEISKIILDRNLDMR